MLKIVFFGKNRIECAQNDIEALWVKTEKYAKYGFMHAFININSCFSYRFGIHNCSFGHVHWAVNVMLMRHLLNKKDRWDSGKPRPPTNTFL